MIISDELWDDNIYSICDSFRGNLMIVISNGNRT